MYLPMERKEEESGRVDLNHRPLAPHASALAKLRHAPIKWAYCSGGPGKEQAFFREIVDPNVAARARRRELRRDSRKKRQIP